MEKLSLEQSLRYLLAGGMFVFSWFAAHGRLREGLQAFPSLQGAAVLLALALLAGSLNYALHRALLYPFLYEFWVARLAPLDSAPARKSRMRFYRPSDVALQWDMRRWTAKTDQKHPIGRFSEWAAQVHFLYTTAWAVLGAILIDVCAPGGLTLFSSRTSVSWVGIGLLVVGLVSFSAAAASHYRYLYFEKAILWPTEDSGVGREPN